jgi:hypothetical protein
MRIVTGPRRAGSSRIARVAIVAHSRPDSFSRLPATSSLVSARPRCAQHATCGA